MMINIILQNIVTFRSDWRNLVSEGETNYLITGHIGKSNLKEDQYKCFNEILVCNPYNLSIIICSLEKLFDKINLKSMNYSGPHKLDSSLS